MRVPCVLCEKGEQTEWVQVWWDVIGWHTQLIGCTYSAWPCAAEWVPVWNKAQMQNALHIRVAFTTVFKIYAKMRITGDDEAAKDKPAWQGWGVIIGKVKPSSLDFPLCCNELHSWSFRHSRHPCTRKGLRKLPIIVVQLWSLSHLRVLNSHSACFSTVGLLFLYPVSKTEQIHSHADN